MDVQFYPTPPNLARRAWLKFKDRNFIRVLEPEAGNGDLALAYPENGRARRLVLPDVCEIDISKHPTLRSKGLNVVGMDFMQFKNGSIFSHVIMNPPFSVGVQHVLKAWDILWNGEIVAILNADSIRNPFSKERKFLVHLIEQHGEVEFIEKAFTVDEAERKTEVDVALIWLKKRANIAVDIIGPIIEDLKTDAADGESIAGNYREAAELALPNSIIENSVAAFNAAVRSMRDAVVAEARADYYANLLGETMAVRSAGSSSTAGDTSIDYVQKEVGKRYDELKDRAWSAILESTNVTSKLSSAARERMYKEFEQIKKLEFTVLSVYGFICGIVDSQGQIQNDMVCDVFDLISRYHFDNTSFYKGWKSNSRHRTCGLKIKATRFILPGHSIESYYTSLRHESERQLADFDKVFAMLDGRAEPEYSLVEMFRHSFKDLCRGERVSSTYFDCRFYPGSGTIHFFPTNKKLIDRLNRIVGRQRAWLPPEGERVSDSFWLSFDQADKMDKEVRAEIEKLAKGTQYWNHPLNKLFSHDKADREAAVATVDDATTAVLERHGINVDFQLESGQQQQLLLKAA